MSDVFSTGAVLPITLLPSDLASQTGTSGNTGSSNTTTTTTSNIVLDPADANGDGIVTAAERAAYDAAHGLASTAFGISGPPAYDSTGGNITPSPNALVVNYQS